MRPIRKITRRSMFRCVVGGAVGAGSMLTLTGCTTLGYSDADSYDPIGGGGRYAGSWGYSDQDTGRYADPPGRGRGDDRRRRRRPTDDEPDPYADSPGR